MQVIWLPVNLLKSVIYDNAIEMGIISYGEFPGLPINVLGEILNNHPLIITTTYTTIFILSQVI